MHALDDENEDVRWVAAEGLIALGKVGLLTVLSGLIKRADSNAFYKSAHQVLLGSKAYARVLEPVRESLEQLDCAVTAPLAAYEALVALSRTPDTE